ncbi:Transposon Ty3-I Gag-Pol polyprotein [Gossypium australe]|uniref:Transposon Ty3-I Gag-Pol polyprotein n=1 Tax=Gossypium australe TaxID=47621 RepID=A0A5B6UYH0_9ROSI|nr:Transposon Ty3-I Gag-Pol polyprotein [Gossypium australe]
MGVGQNHDGFCSGSTSFPHKEELDWVIVDKLTKSTHFVVVWTNYSLEKLAETYMEEIIRLHDVLSSIVSDLDPSCKNLLELDYILAQSSTLSPMVSLKEYLPLTEFTYNNSYHSSLEISPFEALYGRRCKSPFCWVELSERKLVGPDLIRDTEGKVKIICNHLKIAQYRQKGIHGL